MSDNRQMSVAMQQLVDLIFMATNSTLLRNNTVTLLLAGFSVGRSVRLIKVVHQILVDWPTDCRS
jgi:hypothetical protein